MAGYLRPRTLEEALEALARMPQVIVAGATDHYPARVTKVRSEDILDISGMEVSREIRATEEGWVIPALATWSDILECDLPACFDGLRAAAGTIGGVQIQNRATVCGNVCNASPAADGVPNLLALDASVELASSAARRRVPLEAFLTGYRQTQRRPDELVTAIHVPEPGGNTRSTFLKLGSRTSLVISIVMVAAVISTDAHGVIASAAICVGACSPVATRLPALERRLLGRVLDASLASSVTPGDLSPLAPIDDVRATAEYRREAALVLVRRALSGLAAS